MDYVFAFLVLIFLVSLGLGIFSLLKYKKTKGKKFLVIGIILSFVVPGIILLIIFQSYLSSPSIVYGPEPMMEYGPGPIFD